MQFKLNSQFKPAGSQPLAINKLVEGINKGYQDQTLLGVTGSGKTFTIANVIEKIQKPTLIIAHNKTLAAQLCQEFRNFFPDNAVEYFVSYYDYYQPEAYLPNTDTYIEKDSAINDEVEKLRHAAASSLLSRKDVIVVATVSCIYGLGSPEEYKKKFIDASIGNAMTRSKLIDLLIGMYFERNTTLQRGTFNVIGDTFEICPADREEIYRLEIANDKIEKITVFETVSRQIVDKPKRIFIFPAKLFVVGDNVINTAIAKIKTELEDRVKYFLDRGKITEAERIERRTNYDLEMITEIGYCKGIENYSLYLSNRNASEPPHTLMDFFPRDKKTNKADFLTIIDESHVTIPQIGGMFAGDRSRKNTLIEYGFRLPSARENRPLKFNEFSKKIGQTIFMSATPSKYEQAHAKQIVEQIIRPTGLVDPQTTIRPIANQVKDIIEEIKIEAEKNNRVLVTTLTKKMAEELAKYLEGENVRAKYLHSEVDTLDRVRTLQDLRKGKFDVLVGVNLLREGLDLPEVSLVGILDADKEGFLRSDTSLIQTIGRAARNVNGKVILYADNITGSMQRALDETNRRRKIQIQYNNEHNITPQTIKKNIDEFAPDKMELVDELKQTIDLEKLPNIIKEKEKEMKRLAKELKFEEAALIRDEVNSLRKIKIR